jgi:hypothetical protein
MDGNLVNNYFGNSVPGIKSMDRLNTSLFKGNVFSSGGYSALYGQALSAILALESIDLPERNSADFGIEEYLDNAFLCIIEWPEIYEEELADLPHHEMVITNHGDYREIVFH